MASRTALLISRIYDAAESVGILDTFGRSWPMKGSVLRIRPYVLALLLTWLLVIGVLGLAPLPDLWVNDKVLHFFGMGISTLLTYFILVVPESARRIWFHRRAPLILVIGVNFLLGDVGSEIAQGMLPYRTFDPLDILSNLLGSTAFFMLAHALSKHARKRWEIGRLYRADGQSGRGGDRYGYAHVGEDDYEGDGLEGGFDERNAGDSRLGPGLGPGLGLGLGYGKGKTMRPREDSMSSLISLEGDPEEDVWNERRARTRGLGHGQPHRQTESGVQIVRKGDGGGTLGGELFGDDPSKSKAPPPSGLELAGPAVFDLGDDEEDEEGVDEDGHDGDERAEDGIKGLV